MPLKLGLGVLAATLVAVMLVASLQGSAPSVSAQVPGTETPTPIATSTTEPTATATTVPATATVVATATPVVTGTPVTVAQIQLSSTAQSCASATITAFVTDSSGAPVPNGTTVTFNANVGNAQTTASTNNGIATATLTLPSGSSNNPIINTVTAGGVSATLTIPAIIPCPSGSQLTIPTPIVPAVIPTAVPQQPQQPQQIPPLVQQTLPTTIIPPSTGDAGLK